MFGKKKGLTKKAVKKNKNYHIKMFWHSLCVIEFSNYLFFFSKDIIIKSPNFRTILSPTDDLEETGTPRNY